MLPSKRSTSTVPSASKTSREESAVRYMAAKVNNRLRELSYEVTGDAVVEFLDYTSYDSNRIYATSMRYLIVMAFSRAYPQIQIKFSNSISMGIYGRAVEGQITPEMIDRINAEMNAVVEADLPIVRKQMTISAVRKYYASKGLSRQGRDAPLPPGEGQHLRMRRIQELHVRLHGSFDGISRRNSRCSTTVPAFWSAIRASKPAARFPNSPTARRFCGSSTNPRSGR
ncbi:MAG: hypothetical protein MZU97_01500 [Bacillus subtilis]|nr:hypothetical protein [Bacillus subtilis]